MPQNIFKIYDGRTNFWQWDTGQKLIVLDDSITEVHFSNRDMNHSIQRNVYELNGQRVCNVPDIILQLPRNLVAYAYVSDGSSSHTAKSVKFAVVKRPIPEGYIMDQGEVVDDISRRLELLEALLKDIELGKKEFNKFRHIEDAQEWAKENAAVGAIVVVHEDFKWIPYVVEDDYSLTPICDCEGNVVELNILDGGDGDGHEEDSEEVIQYLDGGTSYNKIYD